MNDLRLRALIRFEIRSGRLPLWSGLEKLFGGWHSGGRCACCGMMISSAHSQYDIECADRFLQMHMHCYDLWCKEPTLAAAL